MIDLTRRRFLFGLAAAPLVVPAVTHFVMPKLLRGEEVVMELVHDLNPDPILSINEIYNIRAKARATLNSWLTQEIDHRTMAREALAFYEGDQWFRDPLPQGHDS